MNTPDENKNIELLRNSLSPYHPPTECCGYVCKRDKLQAAIDAFCKEQEWAVDSWKNQPHIKAIFDLRTP